MEGSPESGLSKQSSKAGKEALEETRGAIRKTQAIRGAVEEEDQQENREERPEDWGG